MHPANISIAEFTYHLPDEKIAKFPLEQRDASKLLVYQDQRIIDSSYKQLTEYLPPKALLVFNQTKVIHARLLFKKQTGGKVEIFCLEPDERYADVQQAMQQTETVYWKCLVGGAGKWKPDQEVVLQAANNLVVTAQQVERNADSFVLKLQWNKDITMAEVLQLVGNVPLPPYLNREAETSDEQRYQTIFAREEGSVAAPTAALHFTDVILGQLSAKQIQQGFVTLHVGAGTFKPVKSETMATHDMHAEWIELDRALLNQILEHLRDKKAIVAVGTTSARTLESAYWLGVRLLKNELNQFEGVTVPQWYPYEKETNISAIESFEALNQYLSKQDIPKIVTRTQIIIAPSYKFRVINGLITNFHQPNSTLLLLVAAIVGDQWKRIYEHALDSNYRFLSYGDGCYLPITYK